MHSGSRGAAVTAAALALLCTTMSSAQRLIVVSSSDGTPYQQALAGIQKQGRPVEALQLRADNASAVAATVARAGRDAAIVTLGAQASDAGGARRAPRSPSSTAWC